MDRTSRIKYKILSILFNSPANFRFRHGRGLDRNAARASLLFILLCITNYLVEVTWTTKAGTPPIIFGRKAQWSGIEILHRRLLSGELTEPGADVHEVNITLAGNLLIEKHTANGNTEITRGTKGNICLTTAGQSLKASWDDRLECLTINLKPSFIEQVALENRFTSRFELIDVYKRRDPLIHQIGLALIDEMNAATPAGRLYAESLSQTLVFHLLKNYSTANFAPENLSGGLSGYRLRRVKEFINENLEQDLNLAEIAETAGLSQFHFARAFRRTTGLTPQQYLMRQRIERAKELLAKDDLPIVEISLRTGFKNQSHFTTLFRKFTKLTPKLWRELKLA